jgi:hypothetical protein
MAGLGTPGKRRGIGGGGGNMQAPPTAPGNGSGGPGIIGGGINVSPAFNEVADATTGRITLAMVNLTILLGIGFYVWTRSAQGGG